MPLSAGKSVLDAALAKAFTDAMKEFRKFDQTGNSGVDKFNAATTAAGLVFGAAAAPAIDAFVKTGLVSTTVVTTGSAAAQAGTGTGAIT
jgi:hypothetical protein|tara:strand:+ start:150 stop:419 length:270 start_codon:yes stop_codon:yes gene_type:complete